MNIVLLEPSPIISEGIASILEATSDLHLSTRIATPAQLSAAITRHDPQLILANPTLLDEAAVTSLASRLHIVALCYQYVSQERLARYSAVINIEATPAQVVSTLRALAQTTATESYDLSARETQILALIAQGLSSKEIADRLNLSIHTINTHRKNITRKTNIRTVAGLAAYALIHNLI